MEQPKTKDLRDYLDIFQRRKMPILVAMGLLFCLSIAIAFLLPPAYRSTATILIEEQEIPPDLVRSTITSYADQRIETIKQQVMSRSTLLKIIERYGLYHELRMGTPREGVLRRFVKDIHIQVINAKVVDKRSQTPTQATIAFTLAYDGETPDLAQKVATELTSLFLNENLKTRERHAQETTAFLNQEAEEIGRHIEQLEHKIAAVKQRASGALPELTPLNMQLLHQADRELMEVDRDIRVLEERKTYLEGELATIKPHTPIISASGERILDVDERLKALRAQYASIISYLSQEHPDIIKMKQEIEALEKEAGEADEGAELIKRLTAERANLASLLNRYGSDHPDIVRSRQVIAALELSSPTQRRLNGPVIRPENPAYINIKAQLTSTVSSLNALKATRMILKRRTEEYAARLEKTPRIEHEYLELTRDRDNSALKYQEIRSKLLEAQASEGLEVQRKGERFSLIDPPDLPEKPENPNRQSIALLGLILAIAGGVGVGAAAEGLDHVIRTPQQLEQLTHVLPLAVIPYKASEEDLKRVVTHRSRRRWAGVGAVVILLILSHFFWFPLDVIWFAALRKFGLS